MGEIEYRTCIRCNESKPTTEYHKQSNTKSGFRTRCKPCRKERSDARIKAGYLTKKHRENPNHEKERKARYHESKKLDYILVYIIKDYDGNGNNYCGITRNPFYRMKSHSFRGKLNTDKYEIVAKVETRVEALKIEASYHDRGYHGRIKGRPINKNNEYETELL